ncbi:alanine racemase [Microbacterium sp. A196]|uniref:alanine racemase n=1 Tax=Microbacterium sp. A196 TaxID=3457320 RepID=UPI003FCFCBC7
MTVSGSLPRAIISRVALRANARAAVGAGGSVADLRGDAFGHGVLNTARIVHDAGVERLLVDDSSIAATLVAEGIDAVLGAQADISADALYGLPGAGTAPVMSLTGRILSLKPLRAGEAVSYGYTHRAERDTTIALVTGGYAQGIVRALGNHAAVGVGTVLRPIVGRVAMDVCVVDLQTSDDAQELGAEIVYFGAGSAVGELATWTRVTGMRATELVAAAGAKAVREWAS